MELIRISAINDPCKFCTIAAFLTLFLLTLFLTNNSPQTFLISTSENQSPASRPTFSNISDAVPPDIEDKTFPPSISPLVDGAADYQIPAGQPTFSNISDAVMLHSFDPPNLEGKTLPPSISPLVDGASEHQIPAGQPNASSSADLFRSFNSSAFEEKLFSSSPESSPTSFRNATSTASEYEIPAGEADSHNSSVSEEKLLLAAPPGPGRGGGGDNKCRMYEGKWVYRPVENPRYHVSQCNFLEEKMSCRRNGRPDSNYEGWGWESDGCHIPLFNGTDMLERMKRKRMIIVGDSLNRNMWESLACLLYTSIPPRRAYVDSAYPDYKVFKAKDYKFTLEFYWAPFLIDLDENHKSGKKVLSLDRLVPASKKWRGADVMVFNSGHWWTHHGKLKVWDMYEYSGEQVEEMRTEVAYERGLTSWAQWVAHNVNPAKTKVYFRSISPEHRGKQWCFNHTRPLSEEVDGPYRQFYPRSMIDVAEQTIREMNGHGERVRYLNITGISSYRIDAHPSIYRFKQWKVITDKYKRLLKSRSDCSHWCLPGLPDTWNRVLYASLFFDNFSAGDLSAS
ncbi:hypothetical protein V2J09_000043 [Rumex salicifolius]